MNNKSALKALIEMRSNHTNACARLIFAIAQRRT